MSIQQWLNTFAFVGNLFGGKFADCVSVMVFISSCITMVESIPGLTGPEKLAKVQELINNGLDTVPQLKKLAKDPQKAKEVIDLLVRVANLLVH